MNQHFLSFVFTGDELCPAGPCPGHAVRSAVSRGQGAVPNSPLFHGCPAQAFPLIVPQGQPSEAIASQGAPRPSRRSWLAQEPPLPCSVLAPEAEPALGHCCWQGPGAGKPTAVKSSQPEELSSAECWHLWARGWTVGGAAQPAVLPEAAGLESCSRAGAEPGQAAQEWAPWEPWAGCPDPALHPPQCQPLRLQGSCCFAGCRTRSTVCGSQGWSSTGPALPSGRRWICLPGRAHLQNKGPGDGNLVMDTWEGSAHCISTGALTAIPSANLPEPLPTLNPFPSSLRGHHPSAAVKTRQSSLPESEPQPTACRDALKQKVGVR